MLIAKSSLKARHDMESQKLPVMVYARIANGAAKSDPAIQTLEYVNGLFCPNLSLIKPPKSAEMKPRRLREIAFISENYD